MLIEYDLTTGERGFIEVGSVVRVSVLSDGRGVVYTGTGQSDRTLMDESPQ
jgi:hypothetical protein